MGGTGVDFVFFMRCEGGFFCLDPKLLNGVMDDWFGSVISKLIIPFFSCNALPFKLVAGYKKVLVKADFPLGCF